jgi:hypothetical protein
MAKIEHTNRTITSPAWAGDYLDRHSLLAGGARVDASQFAADAKGRKNIPSGTLLGRTFTERDAKTGFGVAVDTDDEIYILAFDVTDAAYLPDCELYRHGRLVKENHLPNWSTTAAGLKTKIRTLYECTVGAD